MRVEIDDAEIRVAITTYRMLDLRPLGHLLQKAAGALIRIADVRGDRDGDSQREIAGRIVNARDLRPEDPDEYPEQRQRHRQHERHQSRSDCLQHE